MFCSDMFANETDGKIKGIVMDGELGSRWSLLQCRLRQKVRIR